MVKIFGLTKEEILSLSPASIDKWISDEEIVYIARTVDAYWQYDYEAADQGRVGYHAELKSLRHSDGFFVSKILLQYENILDIIAKTLVRRYEYNGFPRPDWVVGIPDGATKLGEKVAEYMGAKIAEMKKIDKKIVMEGWIPSSETLLFVEDFCTKGTGFKEAVRSVIAKQPFVKLLPYELAILNRGRLSGILVEGVGPFIIVAGAYYPVNDWDAAECPLCKLGSKLIKPKATDENWKIITTAQS